MLNFLFVRPGRVDRAVQIKGRVKSEERERGVEVNHNGFREQN